MKTNYLSVNTLCFLMGVIVESLLLLIGAFLIAVGVMQLVSGEGTNGVIDFYQEYWLLSCSLVVTVVMLSKAKNLYLKRGA